MLKKLTALCITLTLFACAQTGLPPDQRPSTWAQPISMPGLPNLHQVSPTLFRSAQPDFEGLVIVNNMQHLSPQQETPLRTVLSLRPDRSDEKIYPSRNVHYERIEMNTWDIKDADVIKALRIINTPAMQPVLLHCQHGADRTGLISAIYRIMYQGWSKDEAIREMTLGNFGYHPMWKNLVEYITQLDVADLRKKVEAEGPYPEPPFPY